MNTKEAALKKFADRSAVVGILGLGYVGLPLAVVFADAGFKVVGIDPIQSKVDELNRGSSYIIDVPSKSIEKHVNSGAFTASADFSSLRDVDAVSICVPTPLRKTGDPD